MGFPTSKKLVKEQIFQCITYRWNNFGRLANTLTGRALIEFEDKSL